MGAAEQKQVIEAKRIRTVADARAVYNRMFEDNKQRNEVMAQTRNQLEGGRPMDPAKLERNGGSWQTNINFRDAEAAFDRTYLPYWKMVNDVPRKTAVTIDTNSPDSQKWQASFEECADLFFDDWGLGYFINFMIATSEFVRFGPGYTMWKDAYSPRFEALDTERVFLPKRSKMEVEKWEVVAVRRDMTASDLWEKIRTKSDRKRNAYAGWNPDAIEKAILFSKGDAGAIKGHDFARIQDEIVSNDLRLGMEWQPLEVVTLIVRNFEDGGLSTYLFTETGIGESAGDFLYESKSFAKSFKHVFGALFYGVGKGGLVHSIKGFAIKNYPFSMLINRQKCRMMDGANFASSINFQRGAETPDEAPPVESYGAVNVFPEGLTQMTVYPQLDSSLKIVEALSQNQAENNAMYREQQEQIQETDTATQANILANIAGQNSAAMSSIYLAMIGENMFTEIIRRLRLRGSQDEDAKKFVKRMQARGVPVDVIHDAELTVKTGANAGSASAALRDQTARDLLQFQGQPGWNSRWIRENYVAQRLGPQAIRKALIDDEQNTEPAARRMAMLENAAMGHGQPMPVDPNDAHFEHAQEHLKPLAMMTAAYQQNPRSLTPEHIAALTTALPHIAQHVAALEGDETKKQQVKQVKPAFSHVQSVTRGIMMNLQKARQAGQDPRAALAQGN